MQLDAAWMTLSPCITGKERCEEYRGTDAFHTCRKYMQKRCCCKQAIVLLEATICYQNSTTSPSSWQVEVPNNTAKQAAAK